MLIALHCNVLMYVDDSFILLDSPKLPDSTSLKYEREGSGHSVLRNPDWQEGNHLAIYSTQPRSATGHHREEIALCVGGGLEPRPTESSILNIRRRYSQSNSLKHTTSPRKLLDRLIVRNRLLASHRLKISSKTFKTSFQLHA